MWIQWKKKRNTARQNSGSYICALDPAVKINISDMKSVHQQFGTLSKKTFKMKQHIAHPHCHLVLGGDELATFSICISFRPEML